MYSFAYPFKPSNQDQQDEEIFINGSAIVQAISN